jgi:formyltetrahydrofolate synthetase
MPRRLIIYPLCGAVRTMHGLSASPAALNVDIDEERNVVGLF